MAAVVILVLWQVFVSTLSQARTIDVRGGNFTITSPSFPDDYPPDSNVTWTVHHSSPANFSLEFTNVSLERSDDCKFDSLMLVNYIPAYTLLGPVCSNLSTHSLKLDLCYGFSVQFKSDSTVQFQGFTLSVTTVPLPGDELCDYMLDHQARRLSSHIGEVEQHYPSNLNCSWVISGYPNKQIVVQFNTLDVEYSGPDCLYDHIEVWDMEWQGSSSIRKRLAKVCGRHNPWSLFTNSSKLRITFSSDMLDNAGEFVLLYWLNEPLTYVPVLTKNADVTLAAQTESILPDDINPPDDINQGLRLIWKFRTQPGFHIQVNMTRLSTMDISVYNGPDKSFRKVRVSQDQNAVLSEGFHLLVSVDLTAGNALIQDNFTFYSLPDSYRHHTFPYKYYYFFDEIDTLCYLYDFYMKCPSRNESLQHFPNIGNCAYGGLALYDESLSFDNLIGAFCYIYPGYVKSLLRRLALPMRVLYVLYYSYEADRSPQYFSELFLLHTHSSSECQTYNVKTHNKNQMYGADHLMLKAIFTKAEYNISIHYEEFPKDCAIIQLLPFSVPVKQINMVLKGNFTYRICGQSNMQDFLGNVSNPVFSKYGFSKRCSQPTVINNGTIETVFVVNKHSWSLEYILIELGLVTTELNDKRYFDLCRSKDEALSLENNKVYEGSYMNLPSLESLECSFRISLPRGNVYTGYRLKLFFGDLRTPVHGQGSIKILEEIRKTSTKVLWSLKDSRIVSGFESMPNADVSVTVDSFRDGKVIIQALKFTSLRPSLGRTPTNETCVLFENHCYTFKKTGQISWRSARAICHKSGGDLVSVNGNEELQFVRRALSSVWFSEFYENDRGMIFIGLNDLAKANDLRWVDGSPLTYADWYYWTQQPFILPISPTPPIDRDSIQPAPDRSQRCVSMVPGNWKTYHFSTNWRKVNCDLSTHPSSVYAICEYNNTLSQEGNASRTVKSNNENVKYRCEDGWNFVHKTCLKMLYVVADNALVEHICSWYGARIPIIDRIQRIGLKSLIESTGLRSTNAISDILVKEESGKLGCVSVFGHSPLTTLNLDHCGFGYGFEWRIAVCERDPEEINVACHPYQFSCDDGTCLTPDRICDLNKDCSHGEDESNCTRSDNMFTCDSGEQISVFKLCDFQVDCFDESDENLCVHRPCSAFHFECKNKQCISKDQRCNQKMDCIDNSDEQDCDWQTDCDGFSCPLAGCVISSHVQDLQPDCPDKSDADEKFDVSYTYDRKKQDQLACLPYFKYYPADKVCVYDHDSYGRLKYCSNGVHLRHCREFECPEMFKCPESYCIPHHKVCDGVQDCVKGEDETTCDDNTCPGMVRCGSTNQCVSKQNICDREVNCKVDWSDEMFCDLANYSCPGNCSCLGYYFDCRGNQLQNVSDIGVTKSVRVLDVRENNITFLSTLDFMYLTMFYLQHNAIHNLSSLTFKTLNNLILLDLSYNLIEFIPPEAFSGLSRLQTLMMAGNPVHQISVDCFRHVTSLRTLNLSGMLLQELGPRRFVSLRSLEVLDLSKNSIRTLSPEAFASLQTMHVLFLHDNKLDISTPDIFKNVDVKVLRVDSFRFCCAAGKHAQYCYPPAPDDSSCADLLPTTIMRGAAWVFAILAISGNVFVIVWRLYKRLSDVPSVFIFHLSISDLLMGLYLFAIAVADLHYRRVYILHDLKWRASNYCKLIGIIGFISCEMSMYTLVFIAIDRTKKLAFPLSSGQFTVTHAWLIQLVGWGFWALLSLSPLMIPAYFGDYYGRNSICLPFNFADHKGSGWKMTTAIFVGFNTIGLMMIIAMYALIFAKVKESQKRSGRRDRIEVDIARKLSVVIVTDVACMLPIVLTNFMSVLGHPIDRSMASILTNLFLPLNSALNPFLFTLNNINKLSCKKNK